jgi:hypothetical protein
MVIRLLEKVIHEIFHYIRRYTLELKGKQIDQYRKFRISLLLTLVYTCGNRKNTIWLSIIQK